MDQAGLCLCLHTLKLRLRFPVSWISRPPGQPSPDMTGANVEPRIVENYDGGDIVLNAEKNIVMRPDVFAHLKNYIGQDLIVTDGTTLLGADDKAAWLR